MVPLRRVVAAPDRTRRLGNSVMCSLIISVMNSCLNVSPMSVMHNHFDDVRMFALFLYDLAISHL
jgi:hypothetical protein